MKKILLVALAAVLAFSWAIPARADELTDAKSRKAQLDDSLSSINQKKVQRKTELKNAVSAKQELLDVQKEKDKDYQGLQTIIRKLDSELGDINDALDAAEKNYNDQKELLKIRLKAIYENLDKSPLDMLLESKDINDFIDRVDMLSRVAKRDHELAESLLLAKKDVDYKKLMKEQEMQAKQKQAAEQKRSLEQIAVSRASLDDKISTLTIKLDQLERQEDEMLRQSRALDDFIKKYQKKNGTFSGSMLWPTPSCYEISSSYGNRFHPVLKKWKFHTGVDIAASYGAKVLAASGGTVIYAGYNGSYGNCIIIDHGGGIATLYGHLSRILVGENDQVKKGEIIGKVGSTGLSTGPHLHFEVRKDGSTVNPMNYYK